LQTLWQYCDSRRSCVIIFI